jgi:uncharacterized membrane protein
MTETSLAPRYTAAILIALSLILGAGLRLSGLEKRSITHPEMYVPGIPLPEGISEPAPRMTISRILTGTFSSDTHPPGYYLFMLPWTRVVGTSLRAIRLPSAFLGLACIPLIFWVGSLAGWRLAGAVAAALLAVNGYHIFWSQVARMFALACFLGLASTVTLLLIVRGSRFHRLLTVLYVALILAGTATHVFFWTFFAVHLIWTLGNAWGKGALPDFCRAQLLALILGSPLIAFAAYQSGNTVADLSANAFVYLTEFLPFAFALPTRNSGFFTTAIPLSQGPVFWALRGGLTVIAAILLVAALSQLWKSPRKSPFLLKAQTSGTLWKLTWAGAALAATVAIAGFVYMSAQLPAEQIRATIKITKVLRILPFTLMLLAFLLEWIWPRLTHPGRWSQLLQGPSALLVLLGLGPFALLALLAQFRPILNQRGMLFASPYLLLLLSIGLLRLRAVWAYVLVPALAVMCVASCVSYRSMTVDPADYGQFGATLQTEIQPTDLVFVRKAWYETPILYYLQPQKYRLAGGNYAKVCAENPGTRVWVVLLYDDAPAGDVQTALSGYRPVRTVTAPHAKAILYEPPAAAS